MDEFDRDAYFREHPEEEQEFLEEIERLQSDPDEMVLEGWMDNA